MSTDEDTTLGLERSPDPDRIALCLSGGGYREALFHLGALRRLNELGVLSKVSLISSVSGGSILAGHVATQLAAWPPAGEAFSSSKWGEMEEGLHAFVRRDIRTWPLLQRFLFPWNWFCPSTQVRALERIYEKHLTSLKLTELPPRPRFVFCATDLVHGVSWVFERGRVGSYKAGYQMPAPAWPLARAIAASSCFPPVFSPLPVQHFANGKDLGGQPVSLTDGGLYDNLGLQPAEGSGTVLVSDGGAPFVAAVPRGLRGRLKSYLSVMGRQAGGSAHAVFGGGVCSQGTSGHLLGCRQRPERYVRSRGVPPD